MILPFQRVKLRQYQPGLAPEKVFTERILELPNGNERVPALRFVVSPAQENNLLVRLSLDGAGFSGEHLVSAALLKQIALKTIIDPRVMFEAEFMALVPMELDCGIVCSVTIDSLLKSDGYQLTPIEPGDRDS